MSTLFKNNAASKLASGVSIGATSMTVTAGQGDRFPVVVAPDVALITIENASFNEIIKITARALGADTMTIVKAQEGTTDRAWLTGDIVSLRLTAAQAELGANAQAVAAAALAAHAAAADPHPTYTTAAELAAALAAYQALNANLTAISGMGAARATDLAALSAFIGTLLNDADQPAALATLGTLLNTRNPQTAAYPVAASDRGKLIDCTGTWALSMPQATLGANFAFAVRNSGTGIITLTPVATPTPGLIDGVATVALNAGESCLVLFDGTNFETVGRGSSSGAPAGNVSWFAMSTAPTGWLKANGAVVAISAYAALAAAIYCGDANNPTALFGYKTSDAGGTTRSTTGTYIVLPDLRGEFIRGFDDARGVDSGRAFGSAQAGQMPSHTHQLTTVSTSSGGGTAGFNYDFFSPGVSNGPNPTQATGGTSNSSENRPRNIALLACIKF